MSVSRRMLAASIGVGIVFVIGVVVAGGWLFSSAHGVHSLFARAPETTTAVNVTRFAEGSTLSLDPASSPILTTSNLTIVRFSTSQSTTTAEDILVGVKADTTGNIPAWITVIPHSAPQCTALGGAISCGGLALVDAATGKQVDDGATPTSQPEPNTTITSSATTVTGEDTDLSTPVRIGTTETSDLPFTLGEDGTLRDPDGKVLDSTAFDTSVGAWAVSSEVRDTFAGRSVSSTHQVWTITDGHRLLAINGSTVLWSTDLPDGTAELNGFVAQDAVTSEASSDEQSGAQSGQQSGDATTTTSTPRWLVSGTVGVLATPDGIRATNLVTGAQVWSIDTPVTQWLVQDDTLLIWDGDSVVLADLPGSATVDPTASPTTLTVQSGEDEEPSGTEQSSGTTQSGATEQSGSLSPSESDVQSGDATPTVSPSSRADGLPPDLKDLSDATVEIPSSCAPNLTSTSTDSQTHAVTFRDGTARTDEPLEGSATLKSQTYSLFDGTPVSIVVLGCNAGGTTTHDQIAVFDTDWRLLGSLDPIHDDAIETVGAPTTNLSISSVAPLGKTLHVTISPVNLVGQNDCAECSASSAEETALVWNGSTFTQTDARYVTPASTVRAPLLSDVQAFVDAASRGDDQAASQFATPQVIAELNEPASTTATTPADPSASSDASASPSASVSSSETESDTTLRALVFPEGAAVARCEIVPALSDSGFVTMGDSGVFLSATEGLQTGDFVCGVTSTSSDRSWMSPSLHTYSVHLLLHGTADGTVKIFGIGRSAQ